MTALTHNHLTQIVTKIERAYLTLDEACILLHEIEELQQDLLYLRKTKTQLLRIEKKYSDLRELAK